MSSKLKRYLIRNLYPLGINWIFRSESFILISVCNFHASTYIISTLFQLTNFLIILVNDNSPGPECEFDKTVPAYLLGC